MAETNIYLLDRTHAEEESIEEESELGLESSRSQSVEQSGEKDETVDEAGTQLSWPAEDNEPNPEVSTSAEVVESPVKKSRRAALIAGGSLSALALVVVVGTTFVSFEDDGPFGFASELVNKYITPSQAPVESVHMQTSISSGSIGTNSGSQNLVGLEPFEKLSHVVHDQQLERLILGETRLQGVALASIIENAAHQLGIRADVAQQYIRLKQAIELQIAPLIERSHQSAAAGDEKVKAVIDAAINSGFSLGITLASIEIDAIAKESAMEMGVELSVASTVAEQKAQELNILSTAIAQARASGMPDRILGEAIEQMTAMRDVPTTLDEKGGWLSYAADAAELDVAEIEVAAARIRASHQAEMIGMSQHDQRIHADIAAAHARANQLGLDDYQAALFVIEQTGHEQALETMVAERGLGPEAVAALTVHVALSNDAQASPAGLTYIAASVAGAARAEGASVQRQIELANAAIEYQARQNNLSGPDIDAERARVDAMLSAQDSGLSEVEIIALGDRAAVMARQGNSLNQMELEEAGRLAAQEAIRSAGYGQSTEQEMITRTLAYAGTAIQPHNTTSADRYAHIEAQARSEALSRGMSEMASAAYIAKALIQAQMSDAGYTGRVVDVAAAEAEAKARAQLMGVSEARQRELGLSAAQSYMQTLGIGSREQTVILSDIDAAKVAIAKLQAQEQLASFNTPQSGVEEIVEPQLVSVPTEITDKLATLEQRIEFLNGRMTETVELSERMAQDQGGAFSEILDVVTQMEQSVQTQLGEMRGTLESIGAEVERLRANFGWLSNRMCEAEAVMGTFSNPRACEAVYARYTQAGNQAKELVQPQSTQTNAQVPTAPIRRAPETQSQVLPAGRIMGSLPETRPNNESIEHERIFAALPQTQSRQSQPAVHVSSTACDNAVVGYRYVTITENNATIVNQWGATQRIVRDSYVPELGAVIHIQARHQPRFVMFENGIVCR